MKASQGERGDRGGPIGAGTQGARTRRAFRVSPAEGCTAGEFLNVPYEIWRVDTRFTRDDIDG